MKTFHIWRHQQVYPKPEVRGAPVECSLYNIKKLINLFSWTSLGLVGGGYIRGASHSQDLINRRFRKNSHMALVKTPGFGPLTLIPSSKIPLQNHSYNLSVISKWQGPSKKTTCELYPILEILLDYVCGRDIVACTRNFNSPRLRLLSHVLYSPHLTVGAPLALLYSHL